MNDNMLDVKDIMALLQCSDSTVRRLTDKGHIKAIRLTDTAPRRVRREELERYARERGIELDWSRLIQ